MSSEAGLFIGSISIERDFLDRGYAEVCGCDEAGRGPLAGPVVAAAVVYSPCDLLERCKDSKILSSVQRESLYEEIATHLPSATGICEPAEIDEKNIRIASLVAMTRAVEKLKLSNPMILVDGRDKLPGLLNCLAIVGGDARVSVISAASIVAKVVRDRIMTEAHASYPNYGFDRHFGYPTAEHRAAVKRFGPCELHRKSFRGVREFIK